MTDPNFAWQRNIVLLGLCLNRIDIVFFISFDKDVFDWIYEFSLRICQVSSYMELVRSMSSSQLRTFQSTSLHLGKPWNNMFVCG